jgi:uncharacterized membrane protein HdeD (DUF308 family)
MTLVLANNWWAVALRGVCGIVCGIIALLLPGAALAGLALLFGAFALVDGTFALVSAVRTGRAHGRWGTLVFYGVFGIAAGVVAFAAPLLTIVALVTLVAAWAVVTGVLEIAAAVRLRRAIRGEWLLALAGVVSILFGAALFVAPIAGAVVLAWWIGAFVMVTGIVQLALAFRLRSWMRLPEERLGDILRAA